MNDLNLESENRENAKIIGLFLSKFDRMALEIMGFKSYAEAFNVISLAINININSIKNYRDEYDPYLSTKRKGWRNRPMRVNAEDIYFRYKDFEFNELYNIVKSIIIGNVRLDTNYDNQAIISNNNHFANRLIAGKASENFFRNNYEKIEIFNGFEMIDHTELGSGYDFELRKSNHKTKYIEVKGLGANNKSILMTDKEFKTAKNFGLDYYVFIVKNYNKSPEFQIYQNPTEILTFKKNQIIQTNWTTNLSLN